MEKITTDISTFGNLRKGGYTYVDKTDLLWRLVANTEGRQFFISRPRRFGKSLMLSTLRAIFEGKRELFRGLKITKLKYDWKKRPVVMLNMAEVGAPTVDKLRENLSDMVRGLISDFKLKGVRQVGESLYRIYAKIPPEWKIRSEADVKRHFRLFMEMLGAKVAAEEGSAFGYADAIIETKKFVWVFEFKFNRSAKAAIRQIREKGYADQYKGDKRPVTLVGINFRTAKRNIDEPVFAKLGREPR